MADQHKPDVFERAWQIETVLQAASAGDYTQRCDTSIMASFADDPLTTVIPAINLLLGDLQAKERKRIKAEAQLKESIDDLKDKLRTIEEQAQAIRDLSTPVMEIWTDILLLPIVGVVDTRRSMEIMNNLLEAIVASQSKCVIVDVTGVDVVDTKTADYLLKVVRAAALLGTRCVLTGLSPAVAQTLVEIGADLTEVETLRSIKDGLRRCLKHLERMD